MQVMLNTQKALFTLLEAELDENIYDFVPEDSLLPYVTIGDINLAHEAKQQGSVYELQVDLHAYDKYTGRKNLLTLGNEIFELLNAKELEIEDFTHHETRLISQSVELMNDAERYELTASYRVVVSN